MRPRTVRKTAGSDHLRAVFTAGNAGASATFSIPVRLGASAEGGASGCYAKRACESARLAAHTAWRRVASSGCFEQIGHLRGYFLVVTDPDMAAGGEAHELRARDPGRRVPGSGIRAVQVVLQADHERGRFDALQWIGADGRAHDAVGREPLHAQADRQDLIS